MRPTRSSSRRRVVARLSNSRNLHGVGLRGSVPTGSFVYKSLTAVWSNFAAAGDDRLLLSGLVEHRSDVEPVVDAVPGAVVTIARLHAPLAVLEQRIRSREAGDAVRADEPAQPTEEAR
jgi:hypothetical protein